MFDFLGKNKKKEDTIISVISVTKTTSIQEISEVSEIDADEICTIIEKMIAKSKDDSKYKMFRNAHLNRKTNEVVIEKFTKGSSGIAGFVSKIIPGAVSNADWKCKFCSAINKVKSMNCVSCGAQRV